jgi:AraC family transcriptional regulator
MTMHLPISYGNEFAKCFYLDAAPSLLMRPLSRAQLAVTRFTIKQGLPGPTVSVLPEKAFTVSVHLVDPIFQGWGTWVDGKFIKVQSWKKGGIGIYDLESDPRALRTTGFDSIHYNLPRTTLDAFIEDSDLPKVDTFLCDQGTPDPVVYHLTRMLLPYLGPGSQLSDLFFDHFVQMFCGRLVDRYGSVRAIPKVHRGGLTPWQTRRARDLLDEHLDGNLRLAKLAQECGLSVSHFARSFKRSFGTSVHNYLILQRVESAKRLLQYSRESLAEIALQTGFADQAAFSRTFAKIAGIPPFKWRIQHGRK